MRSRAAFRHLMLASTALMPLGIVVAVANPLGPNVAGGGATVTGVGTPSVTVNQSTPRAIVNWNSFNIGAGETTRFVQPDASSIALNRVTGGFGSSQINGMLTANGRVFLVNPDGVMISRSGTINTAGFLATTNDISNANFMAGNYRFDIPGRPSASIVNEGRINAHSHGFAALVAPGVRNSGTITARYGKIGLAAGNDFSLDFYGDQLITLAVGDSIKDTVRDVATGQPLSALVRNDGKLKATGGRVELTAAQARTVVDSVINNSGVIEARSVGTRNGKIVLGGSTTNVAGLPPQTVRVSGKLDVSNTSGKGGTIQVTGEKIVVKAASFGASGATGGGTVLIGGDTGGGASHWAVASIPQAALEARAVANATTVEIDAATTINASATSVGDGGKVIVWADGSTTFAGTITARGGDTSGNGGFAEVSGKETLGYFGTTDLRAAHGTFGTLLLDPYSITISAEATTGGQGISGGMFAPTATSNLNNSELATALGSASVIVTTGGPGSAGPDIGNITVSAPVVWSTISTLTLAAYNDIIINHTPAPGTIRNEGMAAGSLVLRAGMGNFAGTVKMPAITFPTDRVNWTASTGTVSVYYNPPATPNPNKYSNAVNFNNGDGFSGASGGIFNVPVGRLTSYMLVNTFTDLQNLVDPGGNPALNRFALGQDINANGGRLNPFPFTFTGIFEGKDAVTGQNHVISNVNVNGPAPLGFNSGTFRNFTLANWTVNATDNNQNLGLLVGTNTSTGKLHDITISGGTVNGGSFSGIVAGLLAGQNNGEIKGSMSSGTVTVGNGVGTSSNFAGGLVGANHGTIVTSQADATVIGGNYSFVGGLAGVNGQMNGVPALIDLSSATGNVSSPGTGVAAGGLVGSNAPGATIRDSFAIGNVTASGNVPATICTTSCQFVVAGGLVGANFGTVTSSIGTPYATFAGGDVTVGSNAVGGGLVGENFGIVSFAGAAGNVTGVAGASPSPDQFEMGTVLGGLAGINRGQIDQSVAAGDVGTAGVARLTAGGLAGVNSGTITASVAGGNVTAGNFSVVGGLVGEGDANCQMCAPSADGSSFYNTNFIGGSFAVGNVVVGNASLAGGFAGLGSVIVDSGSAGNVTGGGNSILGGFVGVHNIGGSISNSFVVGASLPATVTATGPNSWIGGFVGYNGGVIFDSTTSSTVAGTSSSILGGFAAVNIGWIDPSVANGAVTATGANNILGGFAGLNLGTIDNSTSTGAVTGGDNNIVGGFVGANAAFANFSPGLIPTSSFPAGTVNNSTASGNATGGAGSTVGAQIAATNPGTLPIPGLVQNCADTMCEIFRTGVLAGLPIQPDPVIPDQVLAPPSEPIIPNEVQAPPTTQLLQFRTEPQPPNDALIKLTSLVQTVQQQQTDTNRQTTGPSQVPGTPPASLAPPRPLRAVPGPDGEIRSNVPPLNETRFLANEVVLHVLASTSPASVQQIAQQLGLTLLTQQNLSSLGRTAYRLQIGGGRSVRDIIRSLEAINIIAVAQPNYQFHLVQQVPAAIAPFTASRGDPAQYTMGKLNLNEAHRVASGNNIIVAVIDSEVDRDHAELAGTISQRFDATDSESKAHSHGTAMAGAIVSRERLLGIAPGAKILAVRAFSETSGSAESTSFNILKAMEWAISQGARVINMSFAGPYDPSLERALKDAGAKGVILIGASGNAGPKSAPLWPGADPNVIAVTATDSGDKLFRQANRGPYVSVASPGVEILAPAPQAGYQLSTGTSIATAHISGVVALMLERDPSLTPRDVRLILESTAADLGPKGRDTQFGWGLVNPAKALAMVDERKRQKGTTSAPAPATTPVQR